MHRPPAGFLRGDERKRPAQHGGGGSCLHKTTAGNSLPLRSRGPGTASPGSAVTNQQGRLSLQEGPCQPLPFGRTAGGWAAASEALEEHAGHRGDSSGWPGAEVAAPALTSEIREAVTLDPDKQPGDPSVPRAAAASLPVVRREPR